MSRYIRAKRLKRLLRTSLLTHLTRQLAQNLEIRQLKRRRRANPFSRGLFTPRTQQHHCQSKNRHIPFPQSTALSKLTVLARSSCAEKRRHIDLFSSHCQLRFYPLSIPTKNPGQKQKPSHKPDLTPGPSPMGRGEHASQKTKSPSQTPTSPPAPLPWGEGSMLHKKQKALAKPTKSLTQTHNAPSLTTS